MQINIVSDGLYGNRAFENIGRQFSCRWVTVPYSGSPIMEDIVIDLPPCDLCISYARHPDVILAIVEQGLPVILGITTGPGLVRQAREINPGVVSAPTMCSLEPTTGCKEVDQYAEKFGLPGFVTTVENGKITRIEIVREAPCGSTRGGAAECIGMPLCIETLRHFGLRICHHCVAPRFGKTCDKEVSGALHVRQLLQSIPGDVSGAADLSQLGNQIEKILEAFRKKQAGTV